MPVSPTMSACGQAVEVDRLDVLVDERERWLVRRQRGQQRQAGDRQVAPLAQQRQGVLQAPVRDLEPGVDQDDVGHDRLLRTGPWTATRRRRALFAGGSLTRWPG